MTPRAYVMGNAVLVTCCRQPRAVGEFSSHWAAVAALLRLHHPGFASLGGDSRDDLDREDRMRKAIAMLTPVPGNS